MSDPRHTAIHEAGHAVVGRALTMVCGAASIVADNDSDGHSITADPLMILDAWDQRGKWRGEDMGLRSVYIGRILTLMAGAEAEAEILGICKGGDGDDRYWIGLMLEEVAESSRIKAIEARLRRAARASVRRHRLDIKRVAAALIKRKALAAAEIDAMLGAGFMARPSIWTTADGGDGP